MIFTDMLTGAAACSDSVGAVIALIRADASSMDALRIEERIQDVAGRRIESAHSSDQISERGLVELLGCCRRRTLAIALALRTITLTVRRSRAAIEREERIAWFALVGVGHIQFTVCLSCCGGGFAAGCHSHLTYIP